MRCVSGNALRSGKCAALRAMRGIASNALPCKYCAAVRAMCFGAHNALCCTQSTALYGKNAPHLIGCVVRNAAVRYGARKAMWYAVSAVLHAMHCIVRNDCVAHNTRRCTQCASCNAIAFAVCTMRYGTHNALRYAQCAEVHAMHCIPRNDCTAPNTRRLYGMRSGALQCDQCAVAPAIRCGSCNALRCA